jgi:hyperosmotically inducible protein
VEIRAKEVAAAGGKRTNPPDPSARERPTRIGSRLSHTTHAAELTAAKEAINAMGSDLRKLEELRTSALPWQALLVDRIEPVLVELARHTADAIEHLNNDRGTLASTEYRDAVGNMYAYAGHARKLVAVNLDYAEARERLNRLDASSLEPVANLSPAPEAAEERSSRATKSLEERVKSELLRLPYYEVFDHLTFRVDGDRVALSGVASWPTLKTDAERAAHSVEGVTTVTSDIKVLPLSSHDDRVRLATYRAIYGDLTLARYRLNPHPPIRIIVENGHVALKGVVGSDMDRTIAHMRANSVAGASSVTNDLQVGS